MHARVCACMHVCIRACMYVFDNQHVCVCVLDNQHVCVSVHFHEEGGSGKERGILSNVVPFHYVLQLETFLVHIISVFQVNKPIMPSKIKAKVKF